MSSTILLYHGVTNTTSCGVENFSKKHIQADNFEKQMKYLSMNKHVTTLREIAANPDMHAVAVTFDDAYKNVHDVALPILKKYNIPATFFISTGFVGKNRLFWTDKLEHMINYAKVNKLNIQLGKFDIDTIENKIQTLICIKQQIKLMNIRERHNIIKEILEQTGITECNNIENYKTLSWNDVEALDEQPMYEVGGHGTNHETLSMIQKDTYKYEIQNCIEALEQHLHRKIDLFSYPEGQEEHFNNDIISYLKSLGISICPTAIYGANKKNDDPFHLKRIMIEFMNNVFPFRIE